MSFKTYFFSILFCCTSLFGPLSAFAEKYDLNVLYGQTLPELKAFSLSDLRQNNEPPKGYVITFMSALCPCSDSHVEELKDLARTYTDFQFIFIHSNMTEKHEMASEYFNKKNIPFPVISDPQARIADVFKALKTPHTFVLNNNGELIYKGGVSNSAHFSNAKRNFLRETLSLINQGKPAKIKHGRTLGCQIIRL